MPDPIACANCGTLFTPRRRTARFCSDRCRMAAHRASRPDPDPLADAIATIEHALTAGDPAATAWLAQMINDHRDWQMAKALGVPRSARTAGGDPVVDVTVTGL